MERPKPALGRVDVPSHVVIRSFVSETILLNVENGLYYRLDRDRGVMLQCLVEHGGIGDAARALAGAGWGMTHEIVDELTALCAELEELLLVRCIAA